MIVGITGSEIALRLVLTFVAGALIGLNRGEQERPAGIRTTLLVCFAAAVSMIQVNLLLAMSGKTPESFAVMDLMRLPLGILSGMGFIGGGAILRKGNMAVGVTTAATLWFVTVIGLCFGGGQNILGIVSLAIALIILDTMKRIEKRLPQRHKGTLKLTIEEGGPDPEALVAEMEKNHLKVRPAGRHRDKLAQTLEIEWELSWEAKGTKAGTPSFIEMVEREPRVRQVLWRPNET